MKLLHRSRCTGGLFLVDAIRIRGWVGWLSMWLLAAASHAQSWPSKGITMVVPFEAGGGHDAMARIVAEGLTARLGQAVIVTNKPGASGMIGAELVSRAAPDGYTILFASPSEVVNAPIVNKTMRYDPDKVLAPVTLAGTSPIVIVAWPGTGIKSISDLIAKAKAQPGSMSFGTAGNMGSKLLGRQDGSASHHPQQQGRVGQGCTSGPGDPGPDQFRSGSLDGRFLAYPFSTLLAQPALQYRDIRNTHFGI